MNLRHSSILGIASNRITEILLGALIMSLVFQIFSLENLMPAEDRLGLNDYLPAILANFTLTTIGFLGLSTGWYLFSGFIVTASILDFVVQHGPRHLLFTLFLFLGHFAILPYALFYRAKPEPVEGFGFYLTTLVLLGALTLIVFNWFLKTRIYRALGISVMR